MASHWWQHFWDGMSPSEFLQHELRLTPPQRMAALRAFVGLMLVSLASAALRPPPFVALSFSIVLMFAGKPLDASSALAAVVRLVLEVVAATLLSVLTLALWADQPWFLLPWAVGIITVLLFYSRMTGGSSFPALFYVVSVFYFPLRAVQDAYLALGTNVIALLGGGAVVLTHCVLWPRKPYKTLHRLLDERLERIGHVLQGLSQPAVATVVTLPQAPFDRPVPGVLTDQLQLLQSAVRVRPAMRARHSAYLDLIVELDAWFNLAAWVQRRRRERPAEWSPDATARERCHVLCQRCAEVRALLSGAVPDQAQGINPEIMAPPEPLAHLAFALRQLEQAADRTRAAVVAVRRSVDEEGPASTVAESRVTPIAAVWLTRAFWLENSVPLHFGLKYALGVVVCLLLIQAFNWPGIDTAMMTCLVVAQSSLGADYRKSILRLFGATGGGLLALLFVVVLQPALVTVAGLLLAIAPACGLAAWIASASPRISYMGLQIGYSFASVVLHGVGPVTDIELARDRILGILLGITVMGVLDYLLWPQRAERQFRAPLVRALRTLSKFASEGAAADAAGGLKFMQEIDRDVRLTLELLDQAGFEPGADRPDAEAERTGAGLLVGDAHRIARTLQTRLRYRLGLAQDIVPPYIARRREAVDLSLAQNLRLLADRLAGASGGVPARPREALQRFKEVTEMWQPSRQLSDAAAHGAAADLYFATALCDALDDITGHAQGLLIGAAQDAPASREGAPSR